MSIVSMSLFSNMSLSLFDQFVIMKKKYKKSRDHLHVGLGHDLMPYICKTNSFCPLD
jgi:hypothetical protein